MGVKIPLGHFLDFGELKNVIDSFGESDFSGDNEYNGWWWWYWSSLQSSVWIILLSFAKAGSHYLCPDPQNIVKHMKNGSGDKIGDQSDDHDVDILKQTKVHQSLVPFRIGPAMEDVQLIVWKCWRKVKC